MSPHVCATTGVGPMERSLNRSERTVVVVVDHQDTLATSSTRTVRKWEVFPGKSKFLCNGRIVTGRQPFIFYFTCATVVIISGLFFAFDCPYLWYRLTPAISIIAAVIFIFVMSTLIHTSWSDPGIIPRATPQEARFIEQQIDAAADGGVVQPATDLYQPPRLLDITVRGVSMKLKYCPTCKIFRPPRASHCSSCDNCVDKFDHHCPWVGNCIGRRNYRYFYLFLVSVSLDCIFICSFAVATIVLRSVESDFVTALKNSPTSILEAVVAFFSLWSVIGLAGFHTFLAVCNLTTNEDIKHSYSKSSERKNPYDQGSICRNYCEVICGPIPPSLIDARGVVVVGPRSEEDQTINNSDSSSSAPTTTAMLAAGHIIQNGQTATDNNAATALTYKTVMGPNGYPVMVLST